VIIFLEKVAILALCIYLVPHIANFASSLYPNFSPMTSLIFIVMYGAAMPFFIALYQAIILLKYIDEDTTFSEQSVKSLKNKLSCAIII
ncbi:DUF2975 domain-containing protein, partial [Lysinibacillus sp. D4A3_S15]|uniref:DUF2975 domain-containing protein n=1 Tax=Lysinibacillus sp. D4A3_S15 TaxID=2941227 RepID=UPI0020BDCCB9